MSRTQLSAQVTGFPKGTERHEVYQWYESQFGQSNGVYVEPLNAKSFIFGFARTKAFVEFLQELDNSLRFYGHCLSMAGSRGKKKPREKRRNKFLRKRSPSQSASGPWGWRNRHGDYVPYPKNVSRDLNNSWVGEEVSYGIYKIVRESATEGYQENTQSRYRRKIVNLSARKLLARTELMYQLNLDRLGTPPNFWKLPIRNDLLLELPPSNDVYAAIKSEFLSESRMSTCHIESIELVQSMKFFRRYQGYRSGVNLRSKNERFVWHGTKGEATESIVKTGFKRDYGNTMMYGVGVYFARDASYSANDRFSPPDARGIKHMFYCILLCGEWTVGQMGYRTPPLKPSGDVEYESMVDSLTNPNIFVAPHDNMAFPIALVKFRRPHPPQITQVVSGVGGVFSSRQSSSASGVQAAGFVASSNSRSSAGGAGSISPSVSVLSVSHATHHATTASF